MDETTMHNVKYYNIITIFNMLTYSDEFYAQKKWD